MSLRRAWLMSRACKPMWLSPISPSISAFGVSAATESTTTTSMALDRTSVSTISNACSPVSGWEMSRSSMFTPSFLAYSGSSACSASTNAAMPPSFWTSAIMCCASVVFPEDSGPKISTTRPRGTPSTPSARSSDRQPVGMVSMIMRLDSPNRIMAPSPNRSLI